MGEIAGKNAGSQVEWKRILPQNPQRFRDSMCEKYTFGLTSQGQCSCMSGEIHRGRGGKAGVRTVWELEYFCMRFPCMQYIPRPPKGSKKWTPPPLHWGTWGDYSGVPFFGSFRGLGSSNLESSARWPRMYSGHSGLCVVSGPCFMVLLLGPNLVRVLMPQYTYLQDTIRATFSAEFSMTWNRFKLQELCAASGGVRLKSGKRLGIVVESLRGLRGLAGPLGSESFDKE